MIVVGPTNAVRHPFMERRDVLAVGPVETLGHPFRIVTEVPLERQIGKYRTFSFGTKFLYSDLSVSFDEPVEAVVVWDPGWLRTGTGEGAKHEINRIWELAQEWDAPVIGLFSDWFAAWKVDTGIVGTLAATMYCDAILVDSAGAAALMASVHPLTVTDPTDHRFRPVVELNGFLTHGRLPRLGGGEDVVVPPTSERDIDVAMVSTLHPQHVVLRPYYVAQMQAICEKYGWSFEFTDKASAEEMEELYLNSKVVLNVSLGSQLNCRVYEALACGCMLLTDGWNLGLDGVPCSRFTDAFEMEVLLRDLLELDSVHQNDIQKEALIWAEYHSPVNTWIKVFDAAMKIAPETEKARAARAAFRLEREAELAAN